MQKKFVGIVGTRFSILNSESKRCAMRVLMISTMTGATGCKKPQAIIKKNTRGDNIL